MATTDPIADMLTRIRNANTVYRDRVEIPGSKINRAVAEILKEEGFIRDYEWVSDKKQGMLRVYLKYGPNREKVITGIKRISKPGLRIYAKKGEIPRVLGGLGIAILSTPKGVMSDRKARALGVGGEVICYVW
ncbi:MAG TPA: 30S ribosomal protein S8 [Clostridia bacterium]|nr:30S ribosomal protein S8 [Clostridia bacterium]